jgi:1,2-phenylacetyl-CoA epoxidase catalytic subunit
MILPWTTSSVNNLHLYHIAEAKNLRISSMDPRLNKISPSLASEPQNYHLNRAKQHVINLQNNTGTIHGTAGAAL